MRHTDGVTRTMFLRQTYLVHGFTHRTGHANIPFRPPDGDKLAGLRCMLCEDHLYITRFTCAISRVDVTD